jgi:ribonucleoside-diphosphate reductase alpha chain
MSFEPTSLGRTIFQERYSLGGNESFTDASIRIGTYIATGEENGKRKVYGDRFSAEIADGYFNPGGRIWYGSGRSKPQLANCFVIGCSDSREGWGEVTSDVIIISGLMGGIGINFSPIRPRGYPIRGTGGVATGAVSLMQLINGVGDVIVGGGSRRAALMMCLDINHPDLEEFLNIKLDQDQLKNANVSVVLPPGFSGEYFRELIKNGEDIPLIFNGVPSGKTVNARALWDVLVENAWKSGEPGVLNMDLVNRMNNIHYVSMINSTNPCGEQPLEPNGVCTLGALVLPKFIRNGSIDLDKLDESVRLGVRFLDDVLTVNHYPLQKIESNARNVRRIGLGVMGLHTMLLEMGLNYNSEKSFSTVDRLFSFIKNTAYDASINLAIEKGPFPSFDQRMLDSGFCKTLKRGIRNKIREYGIRNCCLLTVAPTGTTSMVSGVSSGIEPLPPAVYWRTYFKNTDDGSKKRERELVIEDALHKYSPELLQSSIDIPVEDHFRMQAIVQKHVDSGVSKTINLPADYPRDAFGEIWLKYLDQCKGTTVYRYGSRSNEPINPVPREMWSEIIDQHGHDAKTMTVEEYMSESCPNGTCEMAIRSFEGPGTGGTTAI